MHIWNVDWHCRIFNPPKPWIPGKNFVLCIKLWSKLWSNVLWRTWDRNQFEREDWSIIGVVLNYRVGAGVSLMHRKVSGLNWAPQPQPALNSGTRMCSEFCDVDASIFFSQLEAIYLSWFWLFSMNCSFNRNQVILAICSPPSFQTDSFEGRVITWKLWAVQKWLKWHHSWHFSTQLSGSAIVLDKLNKGQG